MGSLFSCFDDSDVKNQNEPRRALRATVVYTSGAAKVDASEKVSTWPATCRVEANDGGQADKELSEKSDVGLFSPPSKLKTDDIVEKERAETIDAVFNAARIPLPPSSKTRTTRESSSSQSRRNTWTSRSRSPSPHASTRAPRRDSAAPSTESKQSVIPTTLGQEGVAAARSTKGPIHAPDSRIKSFADSISISEEKSELAESEISPGRQESKLAAARAGMASSRAEREKPQLGLTIFPPGARHSSYEDDLISASTITPSTASPRKPLLGMPMTSALITTSPTNGKGEKRMSRMSMSRMSRFLSVKRATFGASVLDKTKEDELLQALAALAAMPRLEGREWKGDTDNESLFCY